MSVKERREERKGLGPKDDKAWACGRRPPASLVRDTNAWWWAANEIEASMREQTCLVLELARDNLKRAGTLEEARELIQKDLEHFEAGLAKARANWGRH